MSFSGIGNGLRVYHPATDVLHCVDCPDWNVAHWIGFPSMVTGLAEPGLLAGNAKDFRYFAKRHAAFTEPESLAISL
jgi:hypothetical protein